MNIKLTKHNNRNSSVPVVAFVADDHYAMPLAATISSVIANLGKERKINIFIIDAGISRTKKEKIAQLGCHKHARIEWLKPSKSHRDLLKSLPCGYVGRTCYYKMFVPELLGPEYPRVICLDCDMIVEADITELWNRKLGENYVLAVQDLINPYVSSPFGLRNWQELGRDMNDELFNAGVLVLNAAKWLREDVTLQLVKYLKKHHRHIQLCDQDAMNAVFQNNWGRLNTRWNVLPYMNIADRYSLLNKESHEDLLMCAHLLHYCGPSKPWKARYMYQRGERFFHYLDMTDWSGWRPTSWTIDANFLVYYMRRIRVFLRKWVHL